MGHGTTGPRMALARRRHAGHQASVPGPDVGGDGRLWMWVSRLAAETEPEEPPPVPGMPSLRRLEPDVFEVFDPDGSYLGEVPVPRGTRLAVTVGDLVWVSRVIRSASSASSACGSNHRSARPVPGRARDSGPPTGFLLSIFGPSRHLRQEPLLGQRPLVSRFEPGALTGQTGPLQATAGGPPSFHRGRGAIPRVRANSRAPSAVFAAEATVVQH